MPTYTVDELVQKMEPQAQLDRALIRRCIDGLGLYAAGIAANERHSKKIDEMRKLAENLVEYWGLDDYGANEKASEEILGAFDEKIREARSGGAVTVDVFQTAPNVIYGLHRYGMDMVVGRGRDTMGEILDMGDLMKDIAQEWDFESDVLDNLTARLEAEVREILDGITLPGQSVSGLINAGYSIEQGVMFENGSGIVLAQNPDAASPFVTWRFGIDGEGSRWYEWGNYFSTESRAKIDYINRSKDYMVQYSVKKVPFPTVDKEIAAEIQSFPMPKSCNVPVKVLTESQPMVTVTYSEHSQLRSVTKMPLYLANTLFFEADEKQQVDFIQSGHTGSPYLKTDFRIDYTINGRSESYSGQYDVGSGDQTLTEHILDHAEYYRNKEEHQQYLADKCADELESANARYDFVINELAPFFDKHCDISKDEAAALSEAMGIYDAAAGNPSEAYTPRIAYLDSVVEYCRQSRAALNNTGLDGLTEPPRFVAAAIGYKPALSDPSVTPTDMYAYGYGWEGMIPLGKDRALELFDRGFEVFRLYEDGTEGVAKDRTDITEYDGLFGVEDSAWVKPKHEPPIEVFILNREKYDKGETSGKWLTLPADISTLYDLLLHIGVDSPSETAFTITAVRVSDNHIRDYISKHDSLDELNLLASHLSDLEDFRA